MSFSSGTCCFAGFSGMLSYPPLLGEDVSLQTMFQMARVSRWVERYDTAQPTHIHT